MIWLFEFEWNTKNPRYEEGESGRDKAKNPRNRSLILAWGASLLSRFYSKGEIDAN